jgi:hypothetical protein
MQNSKISAFFEAPAPGAQRWPRVPHEFHLDHLLHYFGFIFVVDYFQSIIIIYNVTDDRFINFLFAM